MAFVFYRYTPSLAAAIIFTVAFALATIAILVQFIIALSKKDAAKIDRKRVLIIIPFIVGGIAEIIAFIARCLGTQHRQSLGPYVANTVLMLVAPPLFAASIYMSLGRIIVMLKMEKYSVIPIKWLTKIFVFGDVVSFFMQGAGGGLMGAGSDKSRNTGKGVVVGGLFVQIVFFGVFVIVLALYQFRSANNASSIATNTRYLPSKWRNWQMYLNVLFASSVLIFVRSIVRVVEFLEGFSGYIISHEAFMYCLDGLLMFFVMLLFIGLDASLWFIQMGPCVREEESQKGFMIENPSGDSLKEYQV